MMAVTAGRITLSAIILALAGVAKSIKALNHKAHKEHKEKLFFSFVLFVCFVVQSLFTFSHRQNCSNVPGIIVTSGDTLQNK